METTTASSITETATTTPPTSATKLTSATASPSSTATASTSSTASAKKTEEEIIRDTRIIYNDFMDTMENKRLTYEKKQSALMNISSSLNELRCITGDNDLGKALDFARGIVNIGINFNMIGASLSWTSFAGGLGMLTSVISIGTLIFGKKQKDTITPQFERLGKLIIQGFEIVLRNIEVLHKRFDAIEDKMIRQHIDIMNRTFELLKQSDGIHNLIFRGIEMAQEQHKVITYDISRIMENLNSCTSLIQSNINAFRCENLHQVIKEIEYGIKTGILTQPKIHKYIAKLDGYYETVAMNG